ncbi:MAG: hypothetical protein INR71_06150 [Terriglobus roseus]|nr:hypothetical protein [Terriglobus roseus]
MQAASRSVLSWISFLIVCCVAPHLCHAASPAQPCDVFGSATPCVAAISTTRALYSSYKGPLYQVRRESDGATQDIGLLPDGYADAAASDRFCGSGSCVISKIYDQSPNHNDMTPAPPGGAAKGPGPNGFDLPAHARALPVTINGHKVYGIAIVPGMGYRVDQTRNIPAHGEAEGVYMVTSALNLNKKCCFDFGNAETNNLDNDKGHMDAINIMCQGPEPCQKPDGGLDMENGIYGHLPVPANTPFVTVAGSNDGQHTFVIYQGNAQSGQLSDTGPRPLLAGYAPMQQEGAIILGIGGDNSNWAKGYFFEGVMTKGMPTTEAMQKVQRNIVAAHYTGTLPH